MKRVYVDGISKLQTLNEASAVAITFGDNADPKGEKMNDSIQVVMPATSFALLITHFEEIMSKLGIKKAHKTQKTQKKQ